MIVPGGCVTPEGWHSRRGCENTLPSLLFDCTIHLTMATNKWDGIHPGEYVIYDEKRREPYIAVGWPSELVASYEREVLLVGFPMDSPWRKRLSVRAMQDVDAERKETIENEVQIVASCPGNPGS